MANMSLKKNPMPAQEPDVRNKNFDEVALGLHGGAWPSTRRSAASTAKISPVCERLPGAM